MAENLYRVQDEDGIVQFETMKEALVCLQSDPSKLGFIVENSSGKVVTVWMRDAIGLGDVWLWHHSPEFKHAVEFWLAEIERDTVDETGLTKAIRDEIDKMLTGRGAEKIYERLVEEVDDYMKNNVSFPFDAEDEEETVDRMSEYAFGVFKREFLSERVVPGTISVGKR